MSWVFGLLHLCLLEAYDNKIADEMSSNYYGVLVLVIVLYTRGYCNPNPSSQSSHRTEADS